MDIDRISRTYTKQELLLTAGLCLAAMLAVQVWHWDIVIPLVVSVAFNLVTAYAIGFAWKRVAKKSPESLTNLYTAVSGFRMLLALLTMFVCYLVCGSEKMLTFIIVFLIFYFVALAHHSIFFARVTNRS